MAHTPLGLSTTEAEVEVRHAWRESYSPMATDSVMKWLATKSLHDRIIHLCARLAFRGIYFPQMKWRHWVQLLFANRTATMQVISEAIHRKLASRPQENASIDRITSSIRG